MKSALSLAWVVSVAVGAQTLPNPSYRVEKLMGVGRPDGIAAAERILDGAYGVAEDAVGNVYVSESNAGLIHRVRPDGMMERFAGTGTLGLGGSGRAALQTNLTHPTILLMDKDGGLLFYEAENCRIRKVLIDGTIADVAGTGRCGGSMGSGTRVRKALDSDLTEVGGMAVDSLGRLVFSQPAAHVVRRVESDGYIRTMAGTGTAGTAGDDAAATSATLNGPRGLASDADGNIYIADSINCRVRKVSTAGVISAVMGAALCATSAASFSGPATTRLEQVYALAYDGVTHSLYATMPRVYRVVRLDMNASRVTPYFGNGTVGAGELAAPTAMAANEPSAIVASARLGLLVGAESSFQVFQVQNGAVRRFAGRWIDPARTAEAAEMPMLRPNGLFLTAAQALLVADTGAGFLLRHEASGAIAVLAGIPYPASFWKGDLGPAVNATLDRPRRVIQSAGGVIYMTDGARIRRIGIDGVINTLVSGLSGATGLALLSEEWLVFSETTGNRVSRYHVPTKKTTLIAGTGAAGYSGDGGNALEATLNSPGDVAYDSQGNILIADRGNRRIRRLLAKDGTIETIAGNGLPLSYSDITGKASLDSGFGSLSGLAVDADDNIYLSEGVRVDVISKNGRVRVLTGFLAEDDDGNRSYLDGAINGASGLAVDAAGRVYIAVQQDGKVLVATPRGGG